MFDDHSERQRTFRLTNGNLLLFKKHPPFGFWTANYSKGQMPNRFRGFFTSFDEIHRRIITYLDERSIGLEEIEDSAT